MSKVYHSLPLDEEKLDDDSAPFTSTTRTLSIDSDRTDGFVPRVRRRMAKHWMWLGHAVLLTTSVTLFTLSFCARNAKPNDAAYTKAYSSYCMRLPTPISKLDQTSDDGSLRFRKTSMLTE